ncbi:MAG TPA: glycosyltransferase family 39 protein [Candidatus Acidoferrales bacterium]|nr:glycosyltransferase family 39 protein [Candidatus Acidoferrales bacterium]
MIAKKIRATLTSVTVIVIVALALRVAFTWNYVESHSHQALSVIPFMYESADIAVSVAQGHGFSSPFRIPTGPTAWMTPVYPALLAGVFRIFGIYTFNSYLAAAGLNILFVSFACIPIFYAGRRIAGVGLGTGAAWLWAIFPNAILLTYESMWEACLSALLAAIILWATLTLFESDRPRDWIGYGLLWGFTLMTNPTLASVLPFLLLWLAWRARKEHRSWLALPTISLAVALLCCVPWTVRNYSVFHRFVPLRSVLGLQLWLGNNPQAQPPWLGNLHPINNQGEREEYIQMGELNYMRLKEREAIRYMRAHPRHVAKLSAERFISIWSGGATHPLEELENSDSGWFDYVLLFNVFAAIAALAGTVLLAIRRSVYAFPLAVFPLVFPWAYYLTLALPRYRLPIDPIVMLLAAIAVAGIFRARKFSKNSAVT